MSDARTPEQRGRTPKLKGGMDPELIEYVRSRPVLYDPTHSRYMDIPLKMSIWNKIGRQLNANPIACKLRWNNIRDNHRRSLRKNPRHGPHYKYSEMLTFMKPFYKRHRRTKQGEAKTEESNQDNDQDNDEDSNEAIMHDEKDSDTQLPSDQLELSCIKSDPSDVEAGHESMVEFDYFEKPSPSEQRYPSQAQAVDAFLGALAPPLKALSPYHLSLAKAEIYATVHKYELKGIVENGWGTSEANPLS